jgi:hypothetical protein
MILSGPGRASPSPARTYGRRQVLRQTECSDLVLRVAPGYADQMLHFAREKRELPVLTGVGETPAGINPYSSSKEAFSVVTLSLLPPSGYDERGVAAR